MAMLRTMKTCQFLSEFKRIILVELVMMYVSLIEHLSHCHVCQAMCGALGTAMELTVLKSNNHTISARMSCHMALSWNIEGL